MPRDLGPAGHHGGHAVRVAHRDGERVELAVLARPEGLLGRHLQRDGLDRDLHGRQRDAILLGEVLERLHLRIDGVEVERHRVDGGDPLDAEVLLRARPDGEQRADAARGEVEIAGDQRLVHGRAAGELHPVGLKVEAELLAMLLEELLLLHDGERQVADAELLREADLGLRLGAGRKQHRGERRAGRRIARQVLEPKRHPSLPSGAFARVRACLRPDRRGA